jgi:DNA-binding response OmpR family regulator
MTNSAVRIFVAEDEFLILADLEAALVAGGFAVSKASTSEEAIAILDSHDMDFRGLVTDVTFGNSPVTGWDIAKHARKTQPEIPVVYMTGASSSEWPIHGVPNSILITKPFAPAQVLAALAQLLNVVSTAHAFIAQGEDDAKA